VVSTLGADLSVVKDSITTKVWQTDITNAVNPISGDVETLQDQYSQLTQTVEGFDAEISSVKSTVSENYEELDEKMTSISATADGITSTVSSLQTKVDNRSYENRNYILLSGDYEAGGETGWTCESTTAAQYLSITTYDGYTQLKKVKIHSGTIFYLMEIDFSQELDNNAEYTLSMRVRPSVAADIFTVLKTASGSKKNLNTFSSSLFTANEWTEISYTFTTDSASYVKLCINESSINSVGRTLDVAWAKLEKGSEVTNWSRAPEDYATNTSVESKIEQLADSITLSVSGGLGDTAIIKLAVGDEEQTKTLDMSDIRQKFAEDTSSVTVSGGTVTFEAGKLLINGGNFTLDTDGKMTAKDGVFTGTITAKAGTIGGLTVSTSSDSTDHVYKNTIYTQTIGIEETVRSGDGTATVTVDTQFGMKPASSRLSDLALYLLAKLNGTQEWTNDIALFSVNHRGKVKCSGIDLYSDRSMGYQNNELLAPENSGNGAPLLISTDNNRLYLNNVIFREKGATGECNGIISDIDPRFGATDYNDTDGQDMGGAEYPWRRIYVRRIYRDDESSISDRKDKKDISPIPENSTDLIMNLKPVQYRWNRGTDNRLHWGFVAQEVAHAAQNTVGDISVFQAVRKGTKNEEHNTDYESIPDSELQWYLSYQELIAPMVSTIQEQERRIERLERMLEKYGVHE
jgi:outer membrane murein-binding lipoprotein Lpp